MKIKLIFSVLILFSFILIGCYNVGNEDLSNFVGTIKKINERTAIVIVAESEESKLGGEVEVGLSVNPNESFQVGDKVKVEYNEVMETSPVTVTAISMEKVD